MVFIDANSVRQDFFHDADLCIVGAGAAGIALALEFAGGPVRVCMLESGGLEFNHEAQLLNDFENVGAPLNADWPLRQRALGGTTRSWFGRCVRWDAIDLKKRPWVSRSGWPLTLEDLDPFLSRACQTVGVAHPEALNPAHWVKKPGFADFQENGITTGCHAFASKLNFSRAHASSLRSSSSLSLFYHATVSELTSSEDGKAVREARVTTPGGAAWRVRAKVFVLAAGGLENPRLLLVSRGFDPRGLGNQHDQVGRYYMNHPRNEGLARLILNSENPNYRAILARLDKGFEASIGADLQMFLTLSREIQEREKLLGVSGFFFAHLSGGLAPLAESLHALRRDIHNRTLTRETLRTGLNLAVGFPKLLRAGLQKIQGKPLAMDHLVLVDQSEQEPDPESRVTLAESKDQLGIPRLRLNWRISNNTVKSLKRFHQLLADHVKTREIGRLESPLLTDSDFSPNFTDASHPSGTTRMSEDPHQGVVDRNCRVFETENLFVAGSSVFPSGGHAAPTLMLLALVVRLADHLKKDFQL
jgi:choline dehydrogenase-like flavoprotein